jgi:hypothetical protein
MQTGGKGENTNPSERVLNNHLTVSIGNPRKQVPNGGINLSMVGSLGIRNGLRPCVCYRNDVMRHATTNACLGFLNNDLPDMMANSMHLIGEAAFIETFGVLKKKEEKIVVRWMLLSLIRL